MQPDDRAEINCYPQEERAIIRRRRGPTGKGGQGNPKEIKRNETESVVLAFVIFTAVVAAPLFAQENPFLGTWKLNVAKSTIEPGPAPKSLTRTITAEGSGAKYSFEGVAADGSPVSYSFASNYDAKDSTVTGAGAPGGADTIALKRIDAHKVDGILKKGGKEIAKVTAVVSKDGKTATVKSRGKTADGKEFSSESVYDKQ